MKLKDVQDTLHAYLRENGIMLILLQISAILTLVYPVYLVMIEFDFLDFLTDVLAHFSVVMYVGYLLGMILSFAKKDMLPVSIALGVRAIMYVWDMIEYRVTLNYIFGALIYAALAFAAFKLISGSTSSTASVGYNNNMYGNNTYGGNTYGNNPYVNNADSNPYVNNTGNNPYGNINNNNINNNGYNQN